MRIRHWILSSLPCAALAAYALPHGAPLQMRAVRTVRGRVVQVGAPGAIAQVQASIGARAPGGETDS